MRLLQDVFDARSLDTETPPNYTTTAHPITLPPMTSMEHHQDHLQYPYQQGFNVRDHSSSPHSSISAASSHESPSPPNGPQRWSAFTGYNLGDIPLLSLIALPVTNMEVRDGSFYTSAYAKHMAQNLSTLMNTSQDSISVQSRTKGIKSRKKNKPSTPPRRDSDPEITNKGSKVISLVKKFNIRKKAKPAAPHPQPEGVASA